MKQVHGWPPNIEEINKVLKTRIGTIFTYGDTIYLSGGGKIDAALEAHEEVHQAQQGKDPAGWWTKYLHSAAFRLMQEVEAHRAEWRKFCSVGRTRNDRRFRLGQIARRLAGPMYGGLTTVKKAKAIIQS